jgi:hypothetical protein
MLRTLPLKGARNTHGKSLKQTAQIKLSLLLPDISQEKEMNLEKNENL